MKLSKCVSIVKTVLAGVVSGLVVAPAYALVITPTNSGDTLVSSLLGAGIQAVGATSYTGVTNQSATFTGGNASGIGFNDGILLTTGSVLQVPGPNNNGPETLGGLQGGPDISTPLNTPSNAFLDGLAGAGTHDVARLAFSFQFVGGGGGDLFFNFVFASEEYVDYVNTSFNDVFAFRVDGVNVALVPGTNLPITINNLNPVNHAAFYRNNVAGQFASLNLDNSFDGLTTVLTAQASGLGAGVHTMEFLIGDTSDSIFDSGVFIQGGTFSNVPTDPALPEPDSLALVVLVLAGAARLRRR